MRTAYEFNGCYYHGCPRCFPRSRHTTTARRGDRTMAECYEATLKKKTALEAACRGVVTKWECDWDREVKLDVSLGEFVEQETSSCETSPPQRRLLWWTHEHRETSPSDHPPRGNYPLPGCHVPLPLSQQVRPLPGGTSRHCERRDAHRHWRLFWTLSSDHRPTSWIVPSRLTVSPRGKIVVSALSYVRGVGNGETASQTIGPLPPYRCSARLTRYVVHAGSEGGRRAGISDRVHSRGVELTRASTPYEIV